MTMRASSLWRNRAFTAFWLGDTISLVGTQVTFVALPLVAMLTLDVSAGQLGFLRACEYLPFLLFMLVFGVWADRSRRRPLMVGSYLIRGILVALVPLLAVLGVLEFHWLAAIAFAIGVGTALFEVCWMSYLPGLVESGRLVEAMGKVATTHAAAEVAGPGLGGLLVQLVKAPYALLLDAVSYVMGAVALMSIRWQEPEPKRTAAVPRQLVRELVDGLRFAFTEPHIVALAVSGAMSNFFAAATDTAFLYYAVRELELSPALIGLTLAAIGVGGTAGALLANRISTRWGVGRVYVGARVLGGAGVMLVPLAGGPTAVIVAMCMTSFFLEQAALANTNVLGSSLRQALTPEHLRGRMNASIRTLVSGVLPFGALAGGLLTTVLGARPALWVAAIGYAAAIVPILWSPIPRLTAMPAAAVSPTPVRRQRRL